MATYVTKVRKESSGSGANRHEHIVGVCLTLGDFRSNQQVWDSMDSGEQWWTRGSDQSSARIRKLTYCPHPSCVHKPYLTTAPDHTRINNLDNLPPC